MFVIFVVNKHLLGHFLKETLFSSSSPLDPYIVNNEYLLICRMYLFNCKQNDHREINSIDIVQTYLNKLVNYLEREREPHLTSKLIPDGLKESQVKKNEVIKKENVFIECFHRKGLKNS